MDSISKFINQSLKILSSDSHSLVFASLADAYRRKGLLKKALQICESGLRKHPKYARAYVVLGCVYFDLKKYKESIESFEKALDLEPGNLLSLRYLSDLYIKLKDVKKVLCVYEMLLLYNPRDAQIKGIIDKIHSAHLEDYDYFSEQSLEAVAKDLSQRELEEKPSIRPLNCRMDSKPSKEEVLNQMLTPFHRSSQKKWVLTMRSERERKLRILTSLMNQLN